MDAASGSSGLEPEREYGRFANPDLDGARLSPRWFREPQVRIRRDAAKLQKWCPRGRIHDEALVFTVDADHVFAA